MHARSGSIPAVPFSGWARRRSRWVGRRAPLGLNTGISGTGILRTPLRNGRGCLHPPGAEVAARPGFLRPHVELRAEPGHHFADALRYLAWTWREPPKPKVEKVNPIITIDGKSTLTMNDLVKASTRRRKAEASY